MRYVKRFYVYYLKHIPLNAKNVSEIWISATDESFYTDTEAYQWITDNGVEDTTYTVLPVITVHKV